MRFRLRTLLILLAILPPLMAIGWLKYSGWRAEQERQRMLRESARIYKQEVRAYFLREFLRVSNSPAGDNSRGGSHGDSTHVESPTR